MGGYQGQPLTVGGKLFGEIGLDQTRSSVIKQTYLLLSLSVACAIAGGFFGVTSEPLMRFLTTWIGWLVAIAAINIIPRVAIAARHNPVLGVTTLALDGFISGIVLSPLLYVAAMVAPNLILAALMITGLVFMGVTGYVMTTRQTFSAPRGLMTGIFFSIIGAVVLNSFLHIGIVGILISVAIGVFGVFVLVFSTSGVLSHPEADSPIPGALMLFAGVFNVFVSALNLLLRLTRR